MGECRYVSAPWLPLNLKYIPRGGSRRDATGKDAQPDGLTKKLYYQHCSALCLSLKLLCNFAFIWCDKMSLTRGEKTWRGWGRGVRVIIWASFVDSS